MARRKDQEGGAGPEMVRHPLLVYYNLGRRYRPPGILLIFMGLFLFLPSFIGELDTDLIDPEPLAIAGGALVLVGLAFVLFARLAMRKAYVQCAPEVLIIQTPFHRTLFSYRRIKQANPVQVSQIYPKESLKGMGKPLMRPLLAMTAVEVQVKSWPVPKRRLRRFLSPYLFSARSEAWLFIVPSYSALIRQLDRAAQLKRDAERRGDTYEDPIERVKYYAGT